MRARVTERGYHFGGDELEAAGVEGLVNALRRFDPGHGTRFSTYANYWIMKLVNQAIQHQAGLTDTEMRRALAVQKLERSSAEPVTARVVARELGSRPAPSRRGPAGRARPGRAALRALGARRLARRRTRRASPPTRRRGSSTSCAGSAGTTSTTFWQFTFRTTSLEEIARERGISRQAMSKRMERCRRAVRESPSAPSACREWFAHQYAGSGAKMSPCLRARSQIAQLAEQVTVNH